MEPQGRGGMNTGGGRKEGDPTPKKTRIQNFLLPTQLESLTFAFIKKSIVLMPAYRKHHALEILCTEAMKPSRAPHHSQVPCIVRPMQQDAAKCRATCAHANPCYVSCLRGACASRPQYHMHSICLICPCDLISICPCLLSLFYLT